MPTCILSPTATHTQTSGYRVQLSILLLAIDRSAADSLTAALSKPGHGVTTVADPVDLFAAAPGYSLVIVDRVKDPYTVEAVIEELRRDDATSQAARSSRSPRPTTSRSGSRCSRRARTR